jgi:hypothetical protein
MHVDVRGVFFVAAQADFASVQSHPNPILSQRITAVGASRDYRCVLLDLSPTA